MHFLAWIKQLLLQDVGLLCSLWFIAFTTFCHFLESRLRRFLTPRFRWWDTAREPDYIQSSKHAWAIFCCVYFCPRYSGTCSTLYSKAYIYIYSTHTCHQQSTCQRPKIHTRQMGLIPQIFISDPAYPECTESQPALPNATMVDSWLAAHSFLVGLANRSGAYTSGQGTLQCSTMMEKAAGRGNNRWWGRRVPTPMTCQL